ncbi:hypothetical protein SELMODRAFT_271571 [Selaginella moellendorffii]|uniref:Glucose 1-dehydrogenase n=1 Tax=Selaginella moellendorffii TaxID=88036 RepID=D8SH28_SELML|nr:uncharacterized protein LOC9661694 [Selaginella moellendorffii]EFJ16451.1 hypothetical protein SELMODRAFT_271571 [Selaginella moellendorffii]|eukprot:XP_002982698.1 uncharacterized protein LOC9661694 [Selaginella moellendorffii]
MLFTALRRGKIFGRASKIGAVFLSSDARSYPGRLAGKTALITGAGSGIGREAALLFAHEGACVAVVDKSVSGAAKTVDAVREFGGKCLAIAGGDVSIPSDVEKMVLETERAFGGLHILFNNAGIMDANDGDAINTPDDVIDRTLDINVKGVIYGCRYGIPAIQRSGGGSVINTASFVAFLGAATPQIAYTASKGAVLALTRELAVLHARDKVRVNSICPGPIQTELMMKVLDTEEKRNRRLVHIPMGRFGKAAEIARAALFLASDESSFVTGASLLVDGGITAAYVTPE